jgi:hypothetical protein
VAPLCREAGQGADIPRLRLDGGAGLRYDCLQEAQLGGAIVLHELVDLTIFGSKTDTTLTGQAATLPKSDSANAGALALLEGTRLGSRVSSPCRRALSKPSSPDSAHPARSARSGAARLSS